MNGLYCHILSPWTAICFVSLFKCLLFENLACFLILCTFFLKKFSFLPLCKYQSICKILWFYCLFLFGSLPRMQNLIGDVWEPHCVILWFSEQSPQFDWHVILSGHYFLELSFYVNFTGIKDGVTGFLRGRCSCCLKEFFSALLKRKYTKSPKGLYLFPFYLLLCLLINFWYN